jgi:vacuolar-type H+-ATPase subunit I/STV1
MTNPRLGQSWDVDRLLKVGAVVAFFVLFAIGYEVGEANQNKEQDNTVKRLDLTKQRVQTCQKEIKMVTGEIQSVLENELQLSEEEHTALKSENELLLQDNNILKEETDMLEEQIDELREELNEKDWVADDEIMELKDVMDLGNNTAALSEIIQLNARQGGVDKEQLISNLIQEIRIKRRAGRECRAMLTEQMATLTKLTGVDHTEIVTSIFGSMTGESREVYERW